MKTEKLHFHSTATIKMNFKSTSSMSFNYNAMSNGNGNQALGVGQLKLLLMHPPCRGNCSASLRRLLRLSAPSWLRMPGSISVSCLVSPWPVMAKVLADKEA